jgi:hypothetical protein
MLRLQLLLSGFMVVSITTVEAMPFSRPQTDLVVPVAAGCGLGVNRALYNGCYPIYPPSYRTYDNPYYVGYYAPYYVTYDRGNPWWWWNYDRPRRRR